MVKELQPARRVESLRCRVEYVRGVTYKASSDLHPVLDDASYVLLRANNIQCGKLVFDDVQYVDRSKVKSSQLLKKGDILICASSGSKGLVGKAAFVKEDMPVTFGAFCCVIRPTRNEAEYLGHYFQSKLYRRTIEKASSGSNINNLKAENFYSLIVPSYTENDARYIASILDEVESHIEALNNQLIMLDSLVKSRFVEMFESSQVWERRTLENCCKSADDIKCGPFGSQLHKEDYLEAGVPVWGIPEVNSSFSNMPEKFISEENAARLERYSLIPGDIAMNRKGNVGQAALFTEENPAGIIHSDVLRIRVDQSQVDPCYLIEQFHNSHIVRDQIMSASTGAIMAGTNVTKLKKIEVLVPPLSLQREFSDFVEQVDKSKSIARKQIDKLQLLYDSLAQEYFGD